MNDIAIIDVWAHNVEDEFRRICELVTTHGFRYVAMDTEFPGVVARPYGTFRSHTDYQYQVPLGPSQHGITLLSFIFFSFGQLCITAKKN